MPLFLDDTFRSHMFPYPVMDEANGNEAGVGAGTASMTRLNALAHPLLVGRQATAADGTAGGAAGTGGAGVPVLLAGIVGDASEGIVIYKR